MEPVLSIVIANYNFGRFLEGAIRSVVDQGMDGRVELIVCDGGSSDNSVEIIKKYEDRISWWCAEKDKGQSDAFNKGFSHAKGKYFTWLNADDLLVEGCLSKVLHEIEKHPECEWFTGNFIRFLESERCVCDVGWGPHFYPYWLQRSNSPIVVFGPTSFYSREVLARAGGFDESLHYVMDTDLWLKFMRMGVKQRRIRCFCWAFRMHCDSKTAEYGEHKPSAEACLVGGKESSLIRSRIGYRQSFVLRVLYNALRLIDGSYITQQVLRLWLKGRSYGK